MPWDFEGAVAISSYRLTTLRSKDFQSFTY
jgi:hypothetical protein